MVAATQPQQTAVEIVAQLVASEHERSAIDRDCLVETFEPKRATDDAGRDIVYCENCKAIVWRQGNTVGVARQLADS